MREPVFVIMAKQPAVGRTKTRLCPPLMPEEAAVLYEALLRDTVELVAGLEGTRPAIAVTPPEATDEFRCLSPPGVILLPVAGRDIGECLSQVLGQLLDAGYPKVIAINSDGPTLPADYLRQAIIQLEQADVVLGPSADGGYYLIGLKQPQPELFRDIAWSTDQVTPQTLARAEAMGLQVAVLPPWYDLDTGADLEHLWTELADLPPETLPHTRRFLEGLVGEQECPNVTLYQALRHRRWLAMQTTAAAGRAARTLRGRQEWFRADWPDRGK